MGCVSLPTPHDTVKSVVKVVIYANKDNMVLSTGTGAVVNDHCIVSATHVFHGEDAHAEFSTNNGKTFPVTYGLGDDSTDIAVACTDKHIGVPWVTFATHDPDQWSPVYTIGFPLGENWVKTEGEWQDKTVVTVLTAPGNSGGPVFTADGVYIGFVDSIDIYQNMAFTHMTNIVKYADIKAMLTALKQPYKEQK